MIAPVLAKNTDTLGIRSWGWVLGAQAIGMLVMSAVLLRVPIKHPLRWMAAIASVSSLIGLLGLHPRTYSLMAAAVIAGAGLETFGTGWNVALGQHIPRHVLPRVSSYDMVGSFVTMPIGILAYGWLATAADVVTLIVVSAIVYAAVALGTLTVPSTTCRLQVACLATTPLVTRAPAAGPTPARRRRSPQALYRDAVAGASRNWMSSPTVWWRWSG